MRTNKSLIQLNFSTAAARNLRRFGNKIQIRVEDDELFLRATNRLRPAADMFPLVRRKVGTEVDLEPGSDLTDRILQTLDLLGYAADRPFFTLIPLARHWLAVQHLEGPPAEQEEYMQVVRPVIGPEVSKQVTETIHLIEQIGERLASFGSIDVQQVLPAALVLAQDIARRQNQHNADGLPASLRKFLDDENLIGSTGEEFDRRVSDWARQSDAPQPTPKVSVIDVQRAIVGVAQNSKPQRHLSDEEARRIIAGFMED
jgi:hypothetical protein